MRLRLKVTAEGQLKQSHHGSLGPHITVVPTLQSIRSHITRMHATNRAAAVRRPCRHGFINICHVCRGLTTALDPWHQNKPPWRHVEALI